MKLVPQEWFCSKCVNDDEVFGFEEAEEPTFLAEFQNKADQFKVDYFGKADVLEYEAELEYWKLIESPFTNITVEYGADLHTSDYGR